MPNSVYPLAKEGLLDGTVRWSDPTVIKAVLVRDYTYSAAHKFVSDVTGAGGGTLHGTPIALASKTVAAGVADAADTSYGSPAASANDHGVLVYQASAVAGGADVAAAAQRVIAFLDTGTNFPIIPNGGTVMLQWDSGANRIFAL